MKPWNSCRDTDLIEREYVNRSVIQIVVDQHAEESAFLWLLRDDAVAAPHYDLGELARLDARVEAHIDGLRVAGEDGWALCIEGLSHEEPGEAFVAAVLALESNDGSRLDSVLDIGIQTPEAFRGVVSATGWVSAECLGCWLPSLAKARSSACRTLGIAGASVNRPESLTARVRALRAVGVVKRHDLSSLLRTSFDSEHTIQRFWASWSAVLLGDKSALGPLKTFANLSGARGFVQRALELALRAMPLPDAHNWLKGLAQDQAHLRDVLIGCGVTGDPLYIPWLIKQMETPEYARVAGESFSMITGVDLAYDDLDTDWPEGFEAGPTEDPADENVEMDQDEDLPWPDPEKLGDWWAKHKSQYQTGVRYLCGKPISIEQCQHVLRYGFQRQRIAAALELALLQPDEPLFETRAPGFRQQELLGLKRR
jgi:uncharacterized protein (TIGR02270 family)